MVHKRSKCHNAVPAKALFITASKAQSLMARQHYLHKKVHNVRRHLLNKDFNDSQDLSFSPSKSCGVNILLRLCVCCKGGVSVHLQGAGLHMQTWIC